MSSNEQVVRDFCSAWLRRDLDEILSYVTDDMEYHNIPVPPVEGKENVALIFKGFLHMMSHIDLEITHIISQGDFVFTERVDRMRCGDKLVNLPVGGFFKLRDGKISMMHEYFNLATFEETLGFKL